MRIRQVRPTGNTRTNSAEFFCSDFPHEHGREIRVAGQASPIHGVELAQRRLARQLRLTIGPVDQLRRSRSIRLSSRPPALRRQNPLRPPEQSQTHSRPRRNTTRPIRPRDPRNHPIQRRPELTGRGGRRRIHRLHRLIIRPRLIRLTLIQPRPQRRLSHLNPVHCIQQRKLPTTGRPNPRLNLRHLLLIPRDIAIPILLVAPDLLCQTVAHRLILIQRRDHIRDRPLHLPHSSLNMTRLMSKRPRTLTDPPHNALTHRHHLSITHRPSDMMQRLSNTPHRRHPLRLRQRPHPRHQTIHDIHSLSLKFPSPNGEHNN